MANITEQSEDKKKVTPDQESWIKERVKTAIQMALSLNKARKTQADYHAYEYGLDGIIEGTVIEIIRLLNLEPSFTNLRKLGE